MTDLSDKAVLVAAKALHKRQWYDAGWGQRWGALTADDKQAFCDDVRLVVRTLAVAGALDENHKED